MASQPLLNTRFAADISQFERELRKLQRINTVAANNIKVQGERAAKAWQNQNFTGNLSRQFASLGEQVKQFAPVLAGAFSVGAVTNAADVYTRFTNSLKVAGVESWQLAEVQEQLFEVAQKNNMELEALGALYGKAAGAAKELGASSFEVMRYTEAVAMALKVQGGSAAAASGALQQLGQVIGGTKVQAEEYNSIIDGARPLLEAVAAGSDRFGGSVGRLTQLVKKGEVTSKEFFDAILKGAPILEEKAAKAATTLGQAFTNVSNSFTKWVGEANQGIGAVAILTQVLQKLSENLPTIANALAIIAGVYAASFIPAVARATAAVAANTVAIVANTAVYSASTRAVMLGSTAMNAARGAAAGLSAVLGGPLGMALTAIGAAAAYWAYSTAQAKQEAAETDAVIADLAARYGIVTEASVEMTNATNNVTKASVVAGAQARGLALDMTKLADKTYLAAAAMRQLAYDKANAKLTEARVDLTNRRQTAAADTTGSNPVIAAGGMGFGVGVYTTPQGREAARRSQENARSRENPELQSAENRVKDLERIVAHAKSEQGVRDHMTTGGSGGAAADATGRTNKRGGAAARAPGDASEEIRQAQLDQLNLQLALTESLDVRTVLQNDILALEGQSRTEAIERQVREGQITKAAGERLLGQEQVNQALRTAALMEEQAVARRERQMAIDEESVAISSDLLRQEADELEERAQLARTIESKHRHEDEALSLRQQADQQEFDLAQRQYALDMQKLGLTQDVIDRMLAQRQGMFERDQTDQAGDLAEQQRGDDPSVRDRIINRAEDFGTLNEQLGDIANGALKDITSGLTDAVMGAKSLQEAFGDMAKSMIAQLIEMAARFVIFEAIGMALGVPGLGKASIGLGGTPRPNIGANASGTDNWRGGLTLVGEAGPELMMLPGGTQIAPNNLLRNAWKQSSATAGGGAPVYNFSTTVNADGAVLTSWVRQEIAQSQAQAIAAAHRATSRDMNKRSTQNLYR
jgi:tape measure domain-containing protein